MVDAEPDARPESPRRRGYSRWIKWLLGTALVAILVAEGVILWPSLHDSWQQLIGVKWYWVASAIWAEAVSFSGFARVQKQLLHSAGVEVSQRKSLAVTYTANSISATLPAGPIFSMAFIYRNTRRWGASPLVASWQLAISGVVAAAGLGLLGLGGALLGFGSISLVTLTFSLASVVALVWAGHYAATHTDALENTLRRIVRKINKIRKKPEDRSMARVREILGQLESVDLNRRDGLLTLTWAILHRTGDVVCLAFCCYAVGANPNWAGLMVAFAAGKAVGTVPFIPAGIGYVEATLIWALTAAGMPLSQAVPAAIIYRMISLILAAVLGWIIFLVSFRTLHEQVGLDTEIDAELGVGTPAPRDRE
ncbi:YbhN family protein [Nocardia sp. NPDC057440]|uniref:lysylphosphatidylglycerol synthase transmembrane domain-containing protein n=1 Tax=Nocardia sp. NPDC057440 TaxID=3346134 RepID=UPI00367216C4